MLEPTVSPLARIEDPTRDDVLAWLGLPPDATDEQIADQLTEHDPTVHDLKVLGMTVTRRHGPRRWYVHLRHRQ